MNRDPAEILASVVRGEAGVEAVLSSTYRRGLAYFVRRDLRDEGEAEDIVQEALRITLETIRTGRLREPEKLAGFLRATARNLVKAEWRRRRREAPLDDDPDRDQPPAGDPEPAEELERADDRRVVKEVLGELRSDRDRQLLIGYYLGEEPREALCRRLEIAEEQFNMVLFRARQRFRELYERAEKRGRLFFFRREKS